MPYTTPKFTALARRSSGVTSSSATWNTPGGGGVEVRPGQGRLHVASSPRYAPATWRDLKDDRRPPAQPSPAVDVRRGWLPSSVRVGIFTVPAQWAEPPRGGDGHLGLVRTAPSGSMTFISPSTPLDFGLLYCRYCSVLTMEHRTQHSHVRVGKDHPVTNLFPDRAAAAFSRAPAPAAGAD